MTPSKKQTVNYGATRVFNITPASDYQIEQVLVDGSPVGAVTAYTFTHVVADHTLSATVAKAPGPTVDDHVCLPGLYSGAFPPGQANSEPAPSPFEALERIFLPAMRR